MIFYSIYKDILKLVRESFNRTDFGAQFLKNYDAEIERIRGRFAAMLQKDVEVLLTILSLIITNTSISSGFLYGV